MPYTALRQHRAHVQPALQPRPIEPQPAPIAAPESAESTAKQGQPAARAERTVLVAARRLERRASRLLRGVERGEQGIDYRAAAALVGQVRGALELEARLLGEIRSANAAIDLFQSPAWIEFRDLLMAALEPFPEAMDAVDATIRAARGGEPAPAAARWGASAPGVEHRFIVELVTPERPGVAPLPA